MFKATVMSILLLISGFAQAEWIAETPETISNIIIDGSGLKTGVGVTNKGGYHEVVIVIEGYKCDLLDGEQRYISVDNRIYLWDGYCGNGATLYFAGEQVSRALVEKFKGHKDVTFKVYSYEFSVDTKGFNQALKMLR